VTTSPNALMAPIHHRAPVILQPKGFTPWLDPEFQDADALKRLLVPWAPEEFEAFPVSALVNSVRHDVEGCRQEQAPQQMSLYADR
jgi:putative SOS response-associated peptidase YedK